MRLELVKLFEPGAILICPNFNIQQVAAMFIVHMRYIMKLDEIKDIKEKQKKKKYCQLQWKPMEKNERRVQKQKWQPRMKWRNC